MGKFGCDPFQVGHTLTNLGSAYHFLKDHGKAKEVHKRALEMKRHCGKDHFEVAFTLTNLGIAYREIKDNEKTKEFLERALEMEEQHCGKDHFHVAITLYDLALTHGCLGDQKKKVELLKRALSIFQSHYGVLSDHCAELGEATGSKCCVRRWLVIGLQLLLRPRTDSGLWSSRNAKGNRVPSAFT